MTRQEIDAAAAKFNARCDSFAGGSQSAAAACRAAFHPATVLETGTGLAQSALAGADGYLGLETGAMPHGRAMPHGGAADIRRHDPKAFPQLLARFDLAHAGATGSEMETAQDLLNMAPLVRQCGVLAVSHTDNEAVRFGLDTALAAFGQRVLRRDAGSVALLFVREPVPAVSLPVAVAMAPARQDFLANLALQQTRLHQMGAEGNSPDAAAAVSAFQAILSDYARRFDITLPAPLPGTSAMLARFADFTELLPDGATFRADAKRHIIYAVERLAGVELPHQFGRCGKEAEPFAPGSAAHGRMIWEITANMSEMLAQRARDTLR